MNLPPFTYHSPKTLNEAAEIHNRYPESQILSGGTFLINNLKARKKRKAPAPDHIVSLKQVEGLRDISIDQGVLSIGSMVTVSQLNACPELKDNLAVLKTVCSGFGTTPIRNMATIGGNLASRVGWTEFSTACIALDAQIHLISQDGENVVSAQDFFKDKTPKKSILGKITIAHQPTKKAAYFRAKRMGDIDFPLLAVCIQLTVDEETITACRSVLNTGGGAAHQDSKLESFLNGKAIDAELAKQATSHIAELTKKDPEEYKSLILKAAVQETIKALITST